MSDITGIFFNAHNYYSESHDRLFFKFLTSNAVALFCRGPCPLPKAVVNLSLAMVWTPLPSSSCSCSGQRESIQLHRKRSPLG